MSKLSPTERQEFWANAAEQDAQSNPVAATLFALLAQPSPAERRAQEKADLAAQKRAEDEAYD